MTSFCPLCMNFRGFKFDSDEYRQHSGLAMGSPINPVAAARMSVHEVPTYLEKYHYQDIMGSNAIWVRYVDDDLLVTPMDFENHGLGWKAEGTKFSTLMRKLS